ncbi:arginase family protein [Acidiphilium iwatense]|uniref:Acetoin utilization protein AcuC n=1 Tax=Acidiphilium iwatense TaxID=768198 RepID=A0ABS9DXV6_9PROT|nr:acetoin utilization protein AcuC [Acidiphilium iwatense]MCF3946526.1 acetoin utilization protein AcuC [Acidiphilium iwatense]
MSHAGPPVFIGADIYRQPIATPPHPLAVIRAPLAEDLARAMGWLDTGNYRISPVADRAALERFHDPAYLDALEQAEAMLDLPEALRTRYRIGADANPIHPAVYRRPATSAGGAILAARLTAHGGIVQVPGAGNHHAWPDRTRGFCALNDAALSILEWLDHGLSRIVYLDLDAHHGDGVEAAFATDPRVLTISVHEAGRWPRTGPVSRPDMGVINYPVPPGFNDTELDFLMDRAILPRIAAHLPEAIMLLPGADALADDRMAKLDLSNLALWSAVGAIKTLAPRLIVLGGGYNPYALARAWAGIWARLNDFVIPDRLPRAALDVLAGIGYFRAPGQPRPARWLTGIADPPNAGTVRDAVRAMAV